MKIPQEKFQKWVNTYNELKGLVAKYKHALENQPDLRTDQNVSKYKETVAIMEFIEARIKASQIINELEDAIEALEGIQNKQNNPQYNQIRNNCKAIRRKLRQHYKDISSKFNFALLPKYQKKIQKLETALQEADGKIHEEDKKSVTVDMSTVVLDGLAKTPKGNQWEDIYETRGYSMIYTQAIRQYAQDHQAAVLKEIEKYASELDDLPLGDEQKNILVRAVLSKVTDNLGAGNCGESADYLIAETLVRRGAMVDKGYRYIATGSFINGYDHAFNVFFNLTQGGQPDLNNARIGDKWVAENKPYNDFIQGDNPYSDDFTEDDKQNCVHIDFDNAVSIEPVDEQLDVNMAKFYTSLLDQTSIIQDTTNSLRNAIEQSLGNISIPLSNGGSIPANKFKADIGELIDNNSKEEAGNRIIDVLAGVF